MLGVHCQKCIFAARDLWEIISMQCKTLIIPSRHLRWWNDNYYLVAVTILAEEEGTYVTNYKLNL